MDHCKPFVGIVAVVLIGCASVIGAVEPKTKAAPGIAPDQLVFRVSPDAKSYRVADPIAIDFSLENRSGLPVRTIPPAADADPFTRGYGIRLERLSNPPMTLLDHQSADNNASSFFSAPGFRTLGRSETFVCRACFHSWVSADNEGIWPLPEGKYRLTVSFDNRQIPEDWTRKETDGQEGTDEKKLAAKDQVAPVKLLHCWQSAACRIHGCWIGADRPAGTTQLDQSESRSIPRENLFPTETSNIAVFRSDSSLRRRPIDFTSQA